MPLGDHLDRLQLVGAQSGVGARQLAEMCLGLVGEGRWHRTHRDRDSRGGTNAALTRGQAAV